MSIFDRIFISKDKHGDFKMQPQGKSTGELYTKGNQEMADDREKGFARLEADISAEKASAYAKVEKLESDQAQGDQGLEDEIVAANDYATAYGNILLALGQSGKDAKEKIASAVAYLETQAKQWSPLAQMKAAETAERLRALR